MIKGASRVGGFYDFTPLSLFPPLRLPSFLRGKKESTHVTSTSFLFSNLEIRLFSLGLVGSSLFFPFPSIWHYHMCCLRKKAAASQSRAAKLWWHKWDWLTDRTLPQSECRKEGGEISYKKVSMLFHFHLMDFFFPSRGVARLPYIQEQIFSWKKYGKEMGLGKSQNLRNSSVARYLGEWVIR